MKGGTLTTIVLAIGLAAVTLPAASASAGTETVETPAGTFYVVEDHNVDDPRSDEPIVCENPVGGFVICPRVGVDTDPDNSAGASIWQETNGCDGLQREPVDCDGDGGVEPADEKVLGCRTYCAEDLAPASGGRHGLPRGRDR